MFFEVNLDCTSISFHDYWMTRLVRAICNDVSESRRSAISSQAMMKVERLPGICSPSFRTNWNSTTDCLSLSGWDFMCRLCHATSGRTRECLVIWFHNLIIQDRMRCSEAISFGLAKFIVSQHDGDAFEFAY